MLKQPRPSQQRFLARDTFFCQVDDGIIMLNLRNNRYVAVEPADMFELERTIRGWPQRDGAAAATISSTASVDKDSRVIEELLSQGFLTTSAEKAKNPVMLTIASSDSIFEYVRERPVVVIGLLDCAKFLYSLAYVFCSLKLTGMQIIRRLSRRSYPCTTSPSEAQFDELLNALATFERLRPWFYTAKDSCLMDSLVLTIFLQLKSIHASITLGVKTSPFAAHAWVRLDTFVLNDDADVVRQYTPLLTT
jgi:hypothetical protein